LRIATRGLGGSLEIFKKIVLPEKKIIYGGGSFPKEGRKTENGRGRNRELHLLGGV